MFVSEGLVFLELHKTGCTHIRNFLSEAVAGEFVGKHNQADREMIKQGGRKILGSIRNPWEWYVSLWAYGCDGKGAIYNRAVSETEREKIWLRRKKSRSTNRFSRIKIAAISEWQKVYARSSDPEAFRQWLRLIHDPQNSEIVADGYEYSRFKHCAGILSYRYLKLFCSFAGENSPMQKLTSNNELMEFDNTNCFIDYFIRNEKLERDLMEAFQRFGYELRADLVDRLKNKPRTNTSSRRLPIDAYYDLDSIKLVREREQLIIRKFGYHALPD